MSKLATLLTKDVRTITRDRLLAPLAFYPLVIALITRLAADWLPIEHADLYLAPAAVVIAPTLVAVIFGFSLVEEREQGTWLLLRVIPLPQRTLLGYLVVTMSSFSLAVGLLSALVYGLPVASLGSFLLLAAAAGLTAPLLAFALGAIASNKIEGFAIAKIQGVIPMLAGLVFLLSPGWQLLLVWNPFYWLYLGLLRAYAGEERLGALAVQWPGYPDWVYVAVPVALCLVGTWLLGNVYRRRAG